LLVSSLVLSSQSGNVTGFGQDAEGALYIVTNASFENSLDIQGTLPKIIPLGATFSAPDSTNESAMCAPSEDLCFPVKLKNGSVSLICL
jgi:hypothetical protein